MTLLGYILLAWLGLSVASFAVLWSIFLSCRWHDRRSFSNFEPDSCSPANCEGRAAARYRQNHCASNSSGATRLRKFRNGWFSRFGSARECLIDLAGMTVVAILMIILLFLA